MPSTEETMGAKWYNKQQVIKLAERTIKFNKGLITDKEWQKNPGLEQIWLNFFEQLNFIKLSRI